MTLFLQRKGRTRAKTVVAVACAMRTKMRVGGGCPKNFRSWREAVSSGMRLPYLGYSHGGLALTLPCGLPSPAEREREGEGRERRAKSGEESRTVLGLGRRARGTRYVKCTNLMHRGLEEYA